MMGNGDPTAFNVLYMKMRQPLYDKMWWKYRHTLTKEDVEDIVHNTFLKVQLYAARYNAVCTMMPARRTGCTKSPTAKR